MLPLNSFPFFYNSLLNMDSNLTRVSATAPLAPAQLVTIKSRWHRLDQELSDSSFLPLNNCRYICIDELKMPVGLIYIQVYLMPYPFPSDILGYRQDQSGCYFLAIYNLVNQIMLRYLRYCFSQNHPPELIRNFCIIAHIDHGKSTLADRFLEITNTIPKNYQNQFLDKLKVERERGITVQAQTVSMRYHYKDKQYLLNLIDTPGHIDFHYEVERSMRGCQGALLLIDATQGVQAQTLANYELAKNENLKIISVFNKIDAICDLVTMQKQVREEMKIQGEISKVSAKTGLNVQTLLHRVIEQIPHPPVGEATGKLKLFLVNSWFVNGKNVICLFYVMSGQLKKGTTIVSSYTNKTYQVFQVGLMQPETVPFEKITPGQIGYVMSNMKQVKEARIGDTFYLLGKKVEPQPGFKPALPMLYAGLYPVSSQDFNQLEKNLEKLVLTDPAVTFTRTSSATLGPGFRCGFLGMLHMDVFRQRLQDEFDVETILTSPSVPYKCKLKRQNKIIDIDNASQAPDKDKAQYFLEPMATCILVSPLQYLKDVKLLCESRRGSFIQEKFSQNKAIIRYKMPFSEIITDFVDKIKSLTQGYGSFEYQPGEFERSDIVKVVIHIMGDPVDALTFLFHERKAFENSKAVCQKIKETIPPHLFTVSIQARIGTRTIAKEDIPHVKKNVTAKCYGGDYSRKKKLLERYKQGKKKLKAIGKVTVGKDTFLHVMKQ